MIELYTAHTFNGQRASIMLEETGLTYKALRVDLMKNEQRLPEFLRLNPNGKIPVIIDHDNEGTEPFILTQSTAILIYLSEKTGQFMPESLVDRARVYEWMQFHAVDIGSVIYVAFYLDRLTRPTQPQAAKQLRKRIHELYHLFDLQLEVNEFLGGPTYSIADITALPAVISQEDKLQDYTHLTRWLQQLKQRPGVQRGLAVPENT